MGDLIGIDVCYEFCNSIRLLVNCKVNYFSFDPIKIITNSAIYNIKCLRKESKIFEIIKLDDENRSIFKNIQLTSDLEDVFPMIRIKNQKEQ